MKEHQLFNMVLLCPDDMKTEESWTAKATKEDLLATYRGWDPLLLKLLDKAEDDKVMKWKLCIYDPLPTWIKGKICLLGDACHPMLFVPSPYVCGAH